MIIASALTLITVTMAAYGGDTSTAPMTSTPQQTPPISAAASFAQTTTLSGINLSIGPEPDELPIIFTSGVAAGDYDKDGDIDLLIVKGSFRT